MALSQAEINRIVSQYIGGSRGYLGDFDRPSLDEFYPVFCDLDIAPREVYAKTNRDRFVLILQQANPQDQAKIVRGVLRKYPANSAPYRTQDLYDQISRLADRLDGSVVTSPSSSTITSAVVRKALDDAETLLQKEGPISAVDRVHTSLHGFLLDACEKIGIECSKNTQNTKLLKDLRANHPALQDLNSRSKSTVRILNACATILDAFDPIRNNESLGNSSLTSYSIYIK